MLLHLTSSSNMHIHWPHYTGLQVGGCSHIPSSWRQEMLCLPSRLYPNLQKYTAVDLPIPRTKVMVPFAIDGGRPQLSTAWKKTWMTRKLTKCTEYIIYVSPTHYVKLNIHVYTYPVHDHLIWTLATCVYTYINHGKGNFYGAHAHVNAAESITHCNYRAFCPCRPLTATFTCSWWSLYTNCLSQNVSAVHPIKNHLSVPLANNAAEPLHHFH